MFRIYESFFLYVGGPKYNVFFLSQTFYGSTLTPRVLKKKNVKTIICFHNKL